MRNVFRLEKKKIKHLKREWIGIWGIFSSMKKNYIE